MSVQHVHATWDHGIDLVDGADVVRDDMRARLAEPDLKHATHLHQRLHHHHGCGRGHGHGHGYGHANPSMNPNMHAHECIQIQLICE
jgi:hypothetical protein